MNIVTPRVFIAATRQNDGKTTTSLGLMAALQKFYPRVGTSNRSDNDSLKSRSKKSMKTRC